MKSLDSTMADEIGQIAQRSMQEVSNYISYLLDLSGDPKRHGELIEIIDPTIDKIEHHISALHTQIAREIDNRVEEFELSLDILNSPITMVGSKPPEYLSGQDKQKWKKLALSGITASQLIVFKRYLVNSFRGKVAEQLQLEELTNQNTAIRKILDKIRKALLV